VSGVTCFAIPARTCGGCDPGPFSCLGAQVESRSARVACQASPWHRAGLGSNPRPLRPSIEWKSAKDGIDYRLPTGKTHGSHPPIA